MDVSPSDEKQPPPALDGTTDSNETADRIYNLRAFTDTYRVLVGRENDLTNHRMTWLLVSQGILLVAVTDLIQNELRFWAAFVCVAAIAITWSIGSSLNESYNARQSMKKRWRGRVRTEGLDPRDLPPLDGAYAERERRELLDPEREPPVESPWLQKLRFPWTFVPWVIGLFWGAILVCLYFPSTFSPADADLPDAGASAPNVAPGAPSPDDKDG